MHSRPFNTLLDSFHSPENILASNAADLAKTGIHPELAEMIGGVRKGILPDAVNNSLEASLAWLEGEGHGLLTRHSPDYPPLLAEIPDPPPLLYTIGETDRLHLPMLAMVGSRRPTSGGRRNARWFAGELAGCGFGICSGLALGIDAESHAGALEAGGLTVAVLGTGIDMQYPESNALLRDRIEKAGIIVSEFNLGTPAQPANFPRRNRIISGLSLGVVVVEASLRSGSMITARFALEQGREVFAVPGSIHNPLARGCHKLIRDGAKLVQGVDDIVEECGGLVSAVATMGRVAAGNPPAPGQALTSTQRRVRAATGYDPAHLDELVLATGLPVEEVTVALLDLELKGLVRRENCGYVLAGG